MATRYFNVCNLDGSKQQICFEITDSCLFGWAGRDQEEVKRHAEELGKEGIRGPKSFPEHFIVAPFVSVHQDEITVIGEKTSGEIEFFFFQLDGNIYVGLGSEHTDRALEAVDMIKSKGICEKPMSQDVWRYEDVKDHWDELLLSSWQIDQGETEEILYQEERLEQLLSLDSLKKEAETLYGSLDGVMIWSGTIATKCGLVFGKHFRGELKDEVLGRTLSVSYDIKTVPADE